MVDDDYGLPLSAGAVLREFLRYNRISQKRAARQSGLDPANLNRIINYDKHISVVVALLLERGIGIDARLLLLAQLDNEIARSLRELPPVPTSEINPQRRNRHPPRVILTNVGQSKDSPEPASNILKRIMKERQLTPTDVADIINANPSTVRAYRDGRVRISVKAAVALERVLGIDAYDLLNRQTQWELHVARHTEVLIADR